MLWNLPGQELRAFYSVPYSLNTITSVSFSPDGQLLATAYDQGRVSLSPVTAGLHELLARGCDWLQDYFVTHPEALKELHACQKK